MNTTNESSTNSSMPSDNNATTNTSMLSDNNATTNTSMLSDNNATTNTSMPNDNNTTTNTSMPNNTATNTSMPSDHNTTMMPNNTTNTSTTSESSTTSTSTMSETTMISSSTTGAAATNATNTDITATNITTTTAPVPTLAPDYYIAEISSLIFLTILALPVGYGLFLLFRKLKRHLRYREFLAQFDDSTKNRNTTDNDGNNSSNPAGQFNPYLNNEGGYLGSSSNGGASSLNGLSTGQWARNSMIGIDHTMNSLGESAGGAGGTMMSTMGAKTGFSFDEFRVVSTNKNNDDEEEKQHQKKKKNRGFNNSSESDEDDHYNNNSHHNSSSAAAYSGRLGQDDEDSSFGNSSPNIGFVEGGDYENTEDNSNDDTNGGPDGNGGNGTYVDLEERDEERNTAQIVSMAVLQTILK